MEGPFRKPSEAAVEPDNLLHVQKPPFTFTLISPSCNKKCLVSHNSLLLIRIKRQERRPAHQAPNSEFPFATSGVGSAALLSASNSYIRLQYWPVSMVC